MRAIEFKLLVGNYTSLMHKKPSTLNGIHYLLQITSLILMAPFMEGMLQVVLAGL